MTEFTELELAAIRSIIGETPEFAEQLNCQLSFARVVKRENSGGGFFTDIQVSEKGAPVDCGRTLGCRTYAELSALKYGMGFVLFLENGKFRMLEGYAEGPEDTSQIDFGRVDFRMYQDETAQPK